MPSTKNLALAVLALAPTALADLKVNNWCADEVHVLVNTGNGACDAGANGACNDPYVIPGGNGANVTTSQTTIPFTQGSTGIAIKVSRENNGYSGVLQYEYYYGGSPQGIYWDLSDLDGSGAAAVGSPFYNDNVKVTPTGDGAGTGTCSETKCTAGQECAGAYNNANDVDTKFCPADTGDMWLDLCEPETQFSAEKRDVVGKVEKRFVA